MAVRARAPTGMVSPSRPGATPPGCAWAACRATGGDRRRSGVGLGRLQYRRRPHLSRSASSLGGPPGHRWAWTSAYCGPVTQGFLGPRGGDRLPPGYGRGAHSSARAFYHPVELLPHDRLAGQSPASQRVTPAFDRAAMVRAPTEDLSELHRCAVRHMSFGHGTHPGQAPVRMVSIS